MNHVGMTLSPLGDSALVLTFSDTVDDAVVERVRSVADALRRESIPGMIDVMPAFATVTVFYDIAITGEYRAFEARVIQAAGQAAQSSNRSGEPRRVEIPVCYGGEHGPDLDAVASAAGLSVAQVIELHSAADYRVHAIGFVPGFAYLGGLPKKLHIPRRETPRPVVASGSVGIGGGQTGVYPAAIPGGWNLIGRTPLRMFDPVRAAPAILQAGDRVMFRPISAEEFAAWK